MKLKAILGIVLTLLMASIVMANTTPVLALPLEGDIEPDGGDNDVDIFDVRRCAKAFGSQPDDDPTTPTWDESEGWDPAADINNDGLVDIFDLRLITKHYGEVE